MRMYNKTSRESAINTRAALTANVLVRGTIMAALSLHCRARRLKTALFPANSFAFQAVLR
jgi:hypothetical protein